MLDVVWAAAIAADDSISNPIAATADRRFKVPFMTSPLTHLMMPSITCRSAAPACQSFPCPLVMASLSHGPPPAQGLAALRFYLVNEAISSGPLQAMKAGLS